MGLMRTDPSRLNGMHTQRAYPTAGLRLKDEALSKKCRVRVRFMRTDPSRLNGMHTQRAYPTSGFHFEGGALRKNVGYACG